MNYSEYFKKHGYKPKYFLGDRVRGLWNKVPFVGTVYIDHRPYVDVPASVKVHLDLPIKYDEKVFNLISVSHKDILGILK